MYFEIEFSSSAENLEIFYSCLRIISNDCKCKCYLYIYKFDLFPSDLIECLMRIISYFICNWCYYLTENHLNGNKSLEGSYVNGEN
jgi:hypothetical protein